MRRGVPVVRRLAEHDRGRERRLPAQAAPDRRAPSAAPGCREVLDLVELGDLADRYPHQLSGGQQQRVALGRALAFPPRLLLLDEPFSNLDAKLRERARTWLRDLQREIGITTVFVTHDQDEALSMSDRIVVMDHGVVRQVGTPEEIYDAPADLFVADFIGTINLLEGHVLRQTDDHIEVAVPGVPDPLLATPVRRRRPRPAPSPWPSGPRRSSSNPTRPSRAGLNRRRRHRRRPLLPGRPRPVPAAARRGHPHRPDLGADPRHRGHPRAPPTARTLAYAGAGDRG